MASSAFMPATRLSAARISKDMECAKYSARLTNPNAIQITMINTEPRSPRDGSGSFALSLNRSVELQFGIVWRAPDGPIWESALQARASWSQCIRKSGRGLSLNPVAADVRRLIFSRAAVRASLRRLPRFKGTPREREARGGLIPATIPFLSERSFIIRHLWLAESYWCAPERQWARRTQWERPPTRPFRFAGSRVGFGP